MMTFHEAADTVFAPRDQRVNSAQMEFVDEVESFAQERGMIGMSRDCLRKVIACGGCEIDAAYSMYVTGLAHGVAIGVKMERSELPLSSPSKEVSKVGRFTGLLKKVFGVL